MRCAACDHATSNLDARQEKVECPLSHLAAYLGRQQSIEVSADTAVDVGLYGQDFGTSLAYNAVGNVVGEAAFRGLARGLTTGGAYLRSDAGRRLLRATFVDTGIVDIGGINVGSFRLTTGLNAVSPNRAPLKRGPKIDPNAPHNATIRVHADLLEAAGNTIVAGGGRLPERLIRTPGGFKTGRRPDILFETATGQLRGTNIGHVNAAGNPVTRELDALRDLNRVIPTDFVPF